MKNQPVLQDFGLSADDKHRLSRLDSIAGDNEIGCRWLDHLLPKGHGCLSELLGGVLFWTLLWPFFIVGLLIVTPLIRLGAHIQTTLDPKAKQWSAYLVALSDHAKTKEEYWTKLSGLGFENELAQVYRQLGYEATVTTASGDKGIDIVLRLNSETTIVQCKQHSQPVGPATARELLGAWTATAAHRAVLASTRGFTPGVYAFAHEHRIQLLDLRGILLLQEKAMSNKNR